MNKASWRAFQRCLLQSLSQDRRNVCCLPQQTIEGRLGKTFVVRQFVFESFGMFGKSSIDNGVDDRVSFRVTCCMFAFTSATTIGWLPYSNQRDTRLACNGHAIVVTACCYCSSLALRTHNVTAEVEFTAPHCQAAR